MSISAAGPAFSSANIQSFFFFLVPKFITLPRRRRRRRRNPDAASPLTEREQAEIAEAQRRSLAEQNGATRAPVSRASASPANDPSDDFEAMLREVSLMILFCLCSPLTCHVPFRRIKKITCETDKSHHIFPRRT